MPSPHAAAIRQLIESSHPREAIKLAVRALQQLPHDPELNLMMGVALGDAGEWDKVRPYLEKAIQLAPNKPDYWMTWGRFLMQRRDPDAEEALLKALELRPKYPMALFEWIQLLVNDQRWSEAKEEAEKALPDHPMQPKAYLMLGMILREGGMIEEAQAVYERAFEKLPDEIGTLSNRSFNSNYSEVVSHADRARYHREFGNQLERTTKRLEVKVSDRNPNKRLRVAYLSQDFREHSCAFFIEELIRAHDRNQVEVILLYESTLFTSQTRKFEKLADRFIVTAGLKDPLFVERLRKEKIDILVDLAGHTANDRWEVLASKPVPIQVTYLGYPNSTGLKTVDARLVDSLTDPNSPEIDQEYREKLIRMEPPFLAYSPPEHAPEVQPRSGAFVFCSFNAMAKVQPRVVALWSRILLACPESKLVMKTRSLNDSGLVRLVRGRFEQHGVPEHQLELLPFAEKQVSHLETYALVDLALDPFPYNGTTTTCDAMWMGVPTLTLAGDRHAGRVGLSLNHVAGLENWVAKDEEEYFAKAVAAYKDPSQVRELRLNLRDRMDRSPLRDGASLSSKIERAYRELWLEFLDQEA